jgi:uncharacterized protein (DUF2126 family)
MKRISQLGQRADAIFGVHDLIVTQGGEPTFVPVNPILPEWNTAALGAEKLLFARRLARHLVPALLPGAVVFQSFGKQFPGEPLPRWRIGLYRSRSGQPVWNDLLRLRLDQPDVPPVTHKIASQFIMALADELCLPNTSLAAYEDFAELMRLNRPAKGSYPLPRFSRRSRRFLLTEVPEADLVRWETLFNPAGYVLPLDYGENHWTTSPWSLPADEDLTLVPGSSPIGLRLPLSDLPEEALRRALTAEAKDGELVVFLPPLPSFEAFCALVRAIEHVAAREGFPPVALEGYAPPDSPDLDQIGFMADPGVIEVNLPPAASWTDFERVNRILYTAAEQSGLRGFKFQFSGRKVSTGGGAHIILGGPSVANNPFIRRPSLLASFLRFFQNHPSLSYIFTGLFIGPSSQAPRVDESAFEVPYELEIALRALEQMPAPGDPAMIDALLRSLLLDWNGNTHRAEISVDKFYSAVAPNGRLGLVEFRAFEMVPTADMFLAANVLLRVLTSSFLEKPYTRPLVEWREALHDRFALPHFLAQDLAEVLDYLHKHGFDFPGDTFLPHLEFRLPFVTLWETGGVRWELRQALEPWPVMGDGTVSRSVDASTDRLQIRARGLSEPAACHASVNGIRIPLREQPGNIAVAGVRYRLFDNAWGLQPHIRAHSPLRFDVLDATSGEILHAFDFMNWKPQSGNYDGLPQTEEEADRRVAERVIPRLERRGQKPKLREVTLSPHAPFTLDLRAVSDA